MTETMFSKQLEILGHKGLGLTEIRVPSIKYQFFSEDENELERVVQEQIQAKRDCYVSINPRYGDSGSNSDVSYLTCIVFDIDPVRPKGQGSTVEQLADALQVALNIQERLALPTVKVCSGSGFHVYVPIKPIEAINHKGLAYNLRIWAKAIQDEFSSDRVKVDSIFDLARVIRVWGSQNSKSNRLCSPDGLLEYRRSDIELSQEEPKRELVVYKPTTRFDKLKLYHPIISKMMKGEGNYASRSEADFSFICALLKAGFSTIETFELAKINPLGRKDEVKFSDVERIGKEKLQVDDDRGTSNYFNSLSTRTRGISTGFKRLDDVLAGLKGERLYIIAARPGQGKTSLSVALAHNVASNGNSILYFPTELGKEAVYDKVMSSVCEIDLRKFQLGEFNAEEKEKLAFKKEYLSRLPFIVKENFSLGTEAIEKAVVEIQPDVVFIDHLQALNYRNGGDAFEMGSTVRKIKEIACKYNVPIVLCVQLNRISDGAEISLSHLKGSGASEEFADAVGFIMSLDFHAKPRPIDLIWMKNRYGSTDTIRMDFVTQYCKFKEAE